MLGRIKRLGWRDDDVRLPCLLGLEGQYANRARSINASDPGRTRGYHFDHARPVVTMHESHGLAILAEQVSRIYIHQRKFARIILNLQGDGGDVPGSVERNGNREGS